MLRHAETAQQLDEQILSTMYWHLLFGKDKQTQLYEPTKGQLISECLFDILNFPKNQQKIDKSLPQEYQTTKVKVLSFKI